MPAEPPRAAWEQLDVINLQEWFRLRVPQLQACPHFLRGRYRHAQRLALEQVVESATEEDERRGWKAFGPLSIMLLHRTLSRGSVGKQELERRCELFASGEWSTLLSSAEACVGDARRRRPSSDAEERKRKREQACAKIRLEELSKARHALTSAALAPGTPETLRQLRTRPQVEGEAIPDEILEFVPDVLVDIEFQAFVETLKAAPRGSSGGPGGVTNEHLKVALDDEDTAALLHRSALRLARAQVPEDITRAYMSARMTALCKLDGRVRGIATGTSFRRLVASCLARTVGAEVEQACAPYQYAMSTRAGTECIGHLCRAATDADATACVLSIDGIGAFDHVRRSAMLRKLLQLERAKSILPFVRMSYAQPTRYVWADDNGQVFEVEQHEGGEQGDPLMPLLFALGIHEALHEVAQ